MPKGRAGISGPGVFYRIRLPEEGQEPKNEKQAKLMAVAAIKCDILTDLKSRRPKEASGNDEEQNWAVIIHAVGGYLGQSMNGLPPTEAERNKAIARIEKAATKLEEEFEAADFHVTDLLHKAMHRRGANFYELKKHLEAITNPMPIVEVVRQSKGRPDPYLETLIRELVQVWTDATGKVPGKTGTDHYKGGRTSPFYRWCNLITGPIIGKNLPRELVDTVIDLCKPDG